MKQKLLNILRLRAIMLVSFVCAAFTMAWADGAYYTLDTTGSLQTDNNGYANTGTVTSGGIEWAFNGNGKINPWRLGGKSLSQADRVAYTKTAMDKAISEVDLTVGAASSITVDTLLLVVASDASFKTPIDTVGVKFVANSTINFKPSSGDSWAKDAYYKFIFTVTVSGSSNKFVEFKKVEFYEANEGGDESVATTIAIDASGITNTNVFAGTAAGSLAATVSVKDGDPINNATVTWSGDNDEVATIDASTGAVTLIAAGTVNFKATYAGVENTYKPSTKSYAMTVINVDPNAPGSENNPYSVADAITYIGTLGTATSPSEVYVSGVISQVDSYNSTYKSITYWISDDGTTTGQMEVYSGKGLDGADFSADTDLAVGDSVTVKGYVKKYNTTYEFDKNNVLVSYKRPVITTPYISLGDDDIKVYAEGTDGVILVKYNNITNVEADVFFCDADGNAATYDWVTAKINDINNVVYVIDANTSDKVRTAYMKVYALDDNAEDVYSDLITITQAGIDYAKLPLVWNGGTKESLLANTGVTANGLGTNYAESNAPYRVKLDTDGDYIQVKTDCQPVLVSVDVKMLGGATKSSITVQESADGDTFTDVEDLTISGSTNSVLYLQTASDFKADTRYVRLYFNKGSNVGVGGIAIEKAFEDAVTIGEIGYATYVTKHNVSFPSEVKAYIGKINNEYVTLTEVTAVAKGTPVILKGAGEYALAPAAASELADVSTNDLKATTEEIEATGKYVLAKPDGKPVGFYLAESGEIAAGKAYIELPAPSVSAFIFMEDGTTAINSLTTALSESGVIYNVAGQRINKLQKGINIVNGKKVLK